jgi:hypothetical protein
MAVQVELKRFDGWAQVSIKALYSFIQPHTLFLKNAFSQSRLEICLGIITKLVRRQPMMICV